MILATRAQQRPYRGVFPVAPTIFDERGELDLEGQRRCIDCMIDAGSHGLCILANFSEQFSLTDEERERVMTAVLDHVAGRVPVIVTTTHFGTRVCAERSRRAQAAGASMVMIMPPCSRRASRSRPSRSVPSQCAAPTSSPRSTN